MKDLIWREFAISIWDADKDGYITPEEGSVECSFSFNEFSKSDQIQVLDMRKLTGGLIRWGEKLTSVREVYYGRITGHPWTIKLKNSSNLEILDIGESIEGIFDEICYGCKKLHTVVFNKVLKEINFSAFRECLSLKSIELPDSLTTLGGCCFQDSGLHTTTIGNGIKTIKWNAFMNCTSMESFYIKATIPPTIEATNGGIFRNCPCTIYVPVGCSNAYKTATNWSAYASRIQEYNF